MIHIASTLLRRPSDGKLLLVRKKGSVYFQLAGGKIDEGETALEALLREIEEELGLKLPADAPQPFGQFESPAANEPGQIVRGEIFLTEIEADIEPLAELETALWIDADYAAEILTLAPLLRDKVLPAYLK